MIHYKQLFFAVMLPFIGLTACNEMSQTGAGSGSSNEAQNGIMNNNELDSSFTESPYFIEWDQNDDQHVSEEEFYEGHVRVMDENADGKVSKEEWDQAMKAYFGGYDDQPESDAWDTNGDGELSKEEIVAALQEENYYENWDNDGDGKLTEEEFAKNVSQTWDTDGDGRVQADEYSDYHDQNNP